MIVRAPLPDEPLKAFLGRMRRHNVCSTDAELFGKLASRMSIKIDEASRINPVEFLAEVYGVRPIFFVRQHTMMPFTKLVGWFDRDRGEVPDLVNRKYLSSALRSPRPHAYLCPHCVEEDIDFRGISYWRRLHQLPGVDWCVKHGVALRRCEGIDILEQSPILASDSSLALDGNQVAQAREHPLVARYARIAEGLLTEISQSLHTADVSVLIRDWSKEQGLRVSLNGKRPLLSDRVAESFPKAWLSLHFPASTRKEAGVFSSWIDGTWFSRKVAASAALYVLALSVMYESSDEALNALANLTPVAVPRKSDVHRMPGAWETGEIVEVWMKHSGNSATIAKDLNLSNCYIRKRLYQAGLPTLGVSAGIALKRALQSYWSGQPLSTACESEGADQAAVESLLRVATERHLGVLWAGPASSASKNYESLRPPISQ
jgi:hypothetical protein